MDARFLSLGFRVPLTDNPAGVTTPVTSTAYSISNTESYLFCDSTANAIVLKAPSPAYRGRSFTVHKSSTDANAISVSQFASEKIGGTAATYICPGSTGTSKRSWSFISDGTDWRVLDSLPAVDSNLWTPTITPITNADASVGGVSYWIRIGDYVHCTGVCVVDPTASGAVTVAISLPVASNLAAPADVAGFAVYTSFTGVIVGDGATDTARLSIANNTLTTANNAFFNFAYVVK